MWGFQSRRARANYNIDRLLKMANETGTTYTFETMTETLKFMQQIWGLWPRQAQKSVFIAEPGTGILYKY